MDKLDSEERELLESFERDEWRPAAGRELEFERYRQYARATFKKEMRVNIRISRKDLEALQNDYTRATAQAILSQAREAVDWIKKQF